MENIILKMIDIFVDTAAESLYGKACLFSDKSKLKSELETYISHQAEENESTLLPEEIDYEGFAVSVKKELQKHIRGCVIPKDEGVRQEARKEIIRILCCQSHAETDESRKRIERMVNDIFDIIFKFYRDKASFSEHVLANDIIDTTNQTIKESEKGLKQTIEIQSQEIKGTLCYFGRNADAHKARSSYSYDARKTKFIGRESELECLSAFLNDLAPILWISISGGASVGKKRLVYQLFEQLDQNDEWDHTSILSGMSELSNILNAIRKNTVICIEYAAESIQEIELFLNHAEIVLHYQAHIHLRLILIDRDEIEMDDDESPILQYRYDGLKLNALSQTEIEELIESYKPDADVADVYDAFVRFDPDKSRLVIALLAADLKKDNSNYDALEYWYNNECKRISQYKKDLSAVSIREIIAYSILLGGGDLKEILTDLEEKGEQFDKWQEVLDNLGLLEENNTLEIEPSILGEFFCIKYFNESGNAGKLIQLLWTRDIRRAASILEKIYTDYDLAEYSWYSEITDLYIPDTVISIDPWQFKNKKFIHRLTLGERIVSIGRSAFRNCTNLKSVSIPLFLEIIEPSAFRDCGSLEFFESQDVKNNNYLRQIGREVFKGCVSLKRVALPKLCTEIGEAAFYRCESLESIRIPEKLKYISHELFAYCSSLKTIMIMPGCTEVGTAAFLKNISLEKVYGAKNVTKICSEAFKGCESLKRLPAFKHLKILNNSAFEGNKALETVDFSQTKIVYLTDKVFYKCTLLKKVILSDFVKKIGNSVFEEDENLEEIITAGTIQHIGSKAFRNCSNLKTFDFIHAIQYLGAKAIDGCACCGGEFHYDKPVCFSGLYLKDASESLVRLLSHLNEVEKITIPKGISRIAPETFSEMHKLIEVTIEDADEIENGCFKKNLLLRKAIINAQIIGDSSFSDCHNLSKVVLGKRVEVVEDAAFAHCYGLGRIKWPRGHQLKRLGRNALTSTYLRRIPKSRKICGFTFRSFAENEIIFLEKLSVSKRIAVPESVVSFEREAFRDLKILEEVIFERHVENIPAKAFAGCDSLIRIETPGIVKSIGDEAFSGCKSLLEFCERNDISHTRIGKGVFSGCSSLRIVRLSSRMKSIPEYSFYGCSDLEIKIPESVTSIGKYAFCGCTNLEIEIPESVTSIGNYAFCGCDRIMEIALKTHALGYGAFKDCGSLVSVDLSGAKLEEIRNDTFQNDVSLCEVFLPLSVNRIGDGAFKMCRSLPEINLPKQVSQIGIGAFQECRMLRTVDIPDGIVEIRQHAFRGCYNLVEVTGMKGVHTIGPSAFYNCLALKNIHLSESTQEIGKGIFHGCKSLLSIELPASLTVLPDHMFEKCERLRSIKIHGKIDQFPVNFAKDCFSLEEIDIPDGLSEISAGAFRNCMKLPVFKIPDSTMKLEASAFFGCKSLESIRIPVNISKIESSVFFGCESLTEIEVEGILNRIGSYAFAECTALAFFPFNKVRGKIGDAGFKKCNGLREVDLHGIEEFGSSAFNNCTSLTQIEIENGNNIPGAAFRGCTGLVSVRLGKNIHRIKKAAFRECSSLRTIEIEADSIAIMANAFIDCSNLKMIVLPKDREVDESAFLNCPAQRYV